MSMYVDISPQTEARLTALAHERGVDLSDLIETVMTDFLSSAERTKQPQTITGNCTLADIVMEVGGVEGLPFDLSENVREYLKH